MPMNPKSVAMYVRIQLVFGTFRTKQELGGKVWHKKSSCLKFWSKIKHPISNQGETVAIGQPIRQ